MTKPGEWVRNQRKLRSMTMRDLERLCNVISTHQNNPELNVSDSTISELENQSRLPAIPKLLCICVALELNLFDLLAQWDLDLSRLMRVRRVYAHSITRLAEVIPPSRRRAVLPKEMIRGVNPALTELLSTMIQKWGGLPVGILEEFDLKSLKCGIIGTEDVGMRPILMGGALVFIDPKLAKVHPYSGFLGLERPIYFLKLATRFACRWCERGKENRLILYTNPAAPRVEAILKDPDEATVIGRVVAVYNPLIPRLLHDNPYPGGH